MLMSPPSFGTHQGPLSSILLPEQSEKQKLLCENAVTFENNNFNKYKNTYNHIKLKVYYA